MTETRRTRINSIIYTVCGFLLMLIDWSRGSQVGSTWAWTVNMMGIVICIMLFTADGWHHYIAAKYAIYSAVMLILFPLGYQFWLQHQTLIFRDKLLTAICNVWFIGICFIRLFDVYILEKTKRFQVRLIPALTAIMFFWMFLSRNEDVWPAWFLCLFLVLYLWPTPREEATRIFDGLLNGILISFFILQGLAFVFRPFDDPDYRYCGMYSNPNMNALFYCVILIMFLIRLFLLRKDGKAAWRRIICFLFTCAMLAFSILTVCKTAWVVEFLLLTVYVIIIDIRRLGKKANWVVRQIIILGVCTFLCVPIVYLPVRYLPPIFHHPIWYDGEYSEARVHSWDPIDSDKYVSFDEVLGATSERMKPFIKKILPSSMLMTTVQAEEIKDHYGIHVGPWFFPFEDERTLTYSSYLGRMATWYYYFTHGNLLGHSNLQGHYTGVGETYIWHAQNVFLQIWFYYGIPAGILFLIVACGTWGKSIYQSWQLNNKSNGKVETIMMFLSLFLLYGLFEAVWYPGQIIMTLVVILPALNKE